MARERTKLDLRAGRLAGLKRRLRSATDSEDRKRLQLLCWAATGEYTLAQLARKARRSRSTVQLWLDRFREGGVKRLLERKSPPGQTSPMALPEVRDQLHVGINIGLWSSVEQVRDWLISARGIRLTPKSIRRQLRKIGVLFCLPRPTPVGRTRASKPKRTARLREHQSPGEVLAYDLGVHAASAYLAKDLKPKLYLGKRPDSSQDATPVDSCLMAFYELLEREECPLVIANKFLDALKKEWAREQLRNNNGGEPFDSPAA